MKTQFKQITFKLALSLFLTKLLAVSTFSFAQQWQQASGMRNRSVFFIQEFHDRYIAGTDSGFWYSLDQGESWTLKNSNFFSVSASTNKEVKALTMLDSFWVASNWNGVFKSRDAGETWTKINGNPAITSLAMDTSTYFLSIVGGGAIVSENGGANWNVVGAPRIYNMCQKDSVVYAASWGGLVQSNDSCNNWLFEDGNLMANDLQLFNGYVYYTLYDLTNGNKLVKAMSIDDLSGYDLTSKFSIANFSSFTYKNFAAINDTLVCTANDSIYIAPYDQTAMMAIDWQRLTKNGIPAHHQLNLPGINSKNYLLALSEDTGYMVGKGVWFLNRSVAPLVVEMNNNNNKNAAYPNPTDGLVLFTKPLNNKEYVLTDLLGNVLEENKRADGNSINIRSYSSGIYFIKVDGENYKIIKN